MADRSSPLGFDTYVGPTAGGVVDMRPDGGTCSGAVLVRNNMRARCMADTIPMINAPGGVIAFGKDVRGWVGAPVTDSTPAERAQELAIIFGRDPRVDVGSIQVRVDAARAGSQYAFLIFVNARTTTQEPISMVMGVSSVTVDILAQQGAA